MILFLILAIGVGVAVMFVLMNKKQEVEERAGKVREILKKDAIVVDFEDGGSTVVKFAGVLPAAESEMMDDKIFAFLDGNLVGKPIVVKPTHIDNGNVVVGEVRMPSGEYVNAALVGQGFARWSVSEAANDAELSNAQQDAQNKQLGIWNPAIMQLVEEKRRQSMMSEEDAANTMIDPETLETKGS